MDFNYVRFTEEWAMLYKPMHHVPGEDSLNRRFFICDSYMNMTSFMEHMDPDCSPCVIVESQQEGNIENGKDYPRYSFYFMVRSGQTHEGYSAFDAKSEAKRVMMDFINFIRAFKNCDEGGNERILYNLTLPSGSYLYELREAVLQGDQCMMNIDIESLTYESLNELYDTWYGIQVTIGDMQVYDMCLDLSLYR